MTMPSEGIPGHFNPERWKALNPGYKRKRDHVVEPSSHDHRSATGLLNQPLNESKIPAGRGLERDHNQLGNVKKSLKLENIIEKPMGPQAPADKLQNNAHAEPLIIYATNSHERKSSKVPKLPSDVSAPTVVELPQERLDAQDIGKALALTGSHKKPEETPGVTKPRDKMGGKKEYKPGTNLKENAKKLWLVRKNLPIWSHSAEIRDGLRHKDIMLLAGETGSGKSTQVPQMLINEPWCKCQSVTATIKGVRQTVKVGGCIAITEPRRVAAISLARRVAEEMGTPLGSASPASKVGYSVRFDNSTSPNTRIKYLTEGMLLQEMLRDPWLREYSAVIVDEVHERGVNVDLVMGFLKNMNAGEKEGRGGVVLKMAIMSATLNIESFMSFFEGPESNDPSGTLRTDGKYNPQSQENVEGEDESEWSGISSSDSEGHMSELQMSNAESDVKISKYSTTTEASRRGSKIMDVEDKILQKQNSSSIATCHIEGRQYPVKVIYSPEPVQDFVDASLRTIFQIHYKEPMPGDVLVFLTGQETIESLESLVNEYAMNMSIDVPKILVLPLFAALPQAAQQRVFQPAPPRTRKIILATNIAETSVTVSGVRFVIDCGKAKIKQFRSRIGLDSLLVKPISKSAATQRKGRAGREAPGQCYRLYTEKDYLSLEPSNTPEILRCDLAQAILTMKARGINDIIQFPFLNSPPREALEKALMQLLQLQALKESGEISNIGTQMAKLPLSVSLARVLLAATEPEMNCLLEVIDIISCLSVENIFLSLSSEEKKAEAEAARRELYRREGDHLTLLTTVQAYASERADKKAWAERHFVSHRAMQSVMVIEITKSFEDFADDACLGCPQTASSPVPILKDIEHPLRTAAELYIDNRAGKLNIEIFS